MIMEILDRPMQAQARPEQSVPREQSSKSEGKLKWVNSDLGAEPVNNLADRRLVEVDW